MSTVHIRARNTAPAAGPTSTALTTGRIPPGVYDVARVEVLGVTDSAPIGAVWAQLGISESESGAEGGEALWTMSGYPARRSPLTGHPDVRLDYPGTMWLLVAQQLVVTLHAMVHGRPLRG